MLRTKVTILVALLLLAPGNSLTAAGPRLKSLKPSGFQRGTEADFILQGERCRDAAELLWYEPGIKTLKLAAEDDNTVKLRIAVAADCPLGEHALRLRTATGLSTLRTVWVGVLPEVQEVEPNNDITTAQPISLDTTINGAVDREDVDYFVFKARRGERVTAELHGIRLGRSMFDAAMAILDDRRSVLVRSDDTALLRQDPFCSLIVPADGKYFVQVRESAFEGNETFNYRLHVGQFPRPTGLLPGGGRPGESLEVTWLGDVRGPRKERITIPARENLPPGATDVPLFACDDQGTAPSPNRLLISDLPNVMEVETPKDPKKGTPFTVPAALNGVISRPAEVDRFTFHATKDQKLNFRVWARETLRSPLDSVLVIYNASGSQLASDDDDGDKPDSRLEFTAPADGDYTVAIHDQLMSGGPDYVYRIDVEPPTPALTMRLPDRINLVTTKLVVPRGNRMAAMVGAQRKDFESEVAVQLSGLPGGVTAQVPVISADREEGPMLLSAAADAPPAAALVDIVGKAVDGKLNVTGHLEQRATLVRGQNARPMYWYDSHRMATAVTREAPFRIEIVAPQVPLVRDGSLELKVRAKRRSGYDSPIALKLLYNPPGVSSSGSSAIAEKAEEATIPLTASDSATMRKWPIVVIGRGSGDNDSEGGIEAASQIVDLEVSIRLLDFSFEKAAVEQGEETSLVAKVACNRPFAGKARVELLGLPAGATAEPAEISKDAEQVEWKIKATKDARVGRHTSLFARAVIVENGESITETVGGAELRIDAPLPPKSTTAKAQAARAPVVAAAAPKPPAHKPLSRLELLRQRSAERTEKP